MSTCERTETFQACSTFGMRENEAVNLCRVRKCTEVHFHAFPIFSNFLIQKAYESMDYHGLSWIYVDFYGFMMHLICRP